MPSSERIADPAPVTPAPARRRRRWRRWVTLAVLAASLAWLNGPGARWLAPVVAGHFLGKAGFRSSFELDGSLTSGLAVHDLRLESLTVLRSLSASLIAVDYSFSDLCNGTVSGIRVDSLHAEIDLAAKSAARSADDGRSFDTRKLMATLGEVRSRILPVGVEGKGIRVNIRRGEVPVVAIGSSSLLHRRDSPEIRISLGGLTDSNGKSWPSRDALLTWNAEDIALDRLDALPGVGLRNLVVRLPTAGEPSATAELHVDDAMVAIEAGEGFRNATADLRHGTLDVPEIARRFGLEIPAAAVVSSLSVNVERLLPDPLAADAEVRVLMEKVTWKDWSAPEVSIDLELAGEKATAAANAKLLDTGVSLHADASLGRGRDRFSPTAVTGRIHVADVPAGLAALALRVKAIDPGVRAPASAADGTFSAVLDRYRPSSVDFSLNLRPKDEKLASPVTVNGRLSGMESVDVTAELDGAKIRAGYQIQPQSYSGEASLDGFRSARIDPWLAVFRAGTEGAFVGSGHWKGTGTVADTRHSGSLDLTKLDFFRKEMPPASASAGVRYDWPVGITLENLKLTAAGQTVAGNAALSGGVLTISGLQWSDRENPLATVTAELPVPQDLSNWRESLATDHRPVSLNAESRVLSLALLKDWLPAAAKLDPASTGRLTLKVAGTWQKPEVDLLAELKNLRSPEQPKAPPADLTLKVAGRDSLLKADARVTTPDYPPALVTASMPFRPVEWAEDPVILTTENFSARLDLPKVDIARFGSLVSGVGKISGVLTGGVELGGQIGKPAVKGRVTLSNGGFTLANGKLPPVTGAECAVDWTLEKITLAKFRASMSAGTVDASGTIGLVDMKPGPVDIRLRANQLPLMRDESIIVRTNADLRLSGTFEKASLSGSVGVVNSLFFRDIELLPIGSPFTGPTAAALPKVDAARAMPGSSIPLPFRDWTLDVRARTVNPFLVRGNLATGQAEADVRIRGTVGTPAPDGLVTVKDVRAALPFSTLNVHKGLLRFTPSSGFDPVLEIRGTAEPRPYRVNAFVYGSLSKPEILLTSSPPLPEAEIMTLLAAGTTTAGLEDTQAASSRAMQLVLEEFRRGRFAGSRYLRPVFSLLDRVDFSLAEEDPYSGESFSTATINLTDRWYVSAGMGAEGDTRLMGIWRITFR